jgi:hypothetical protein
MCWVITGARRGVFAALRERASAQAAFAADRAGTCGDVAGLGRGDSEVALGCLHIPGATRAPRAICQLWI